MLIEMPTTAELPNSSVLRLSKDAQDCIYRIAKIDGCSLETALEMSVLVGSDFYSSDFWGSKIAEYYEETGTFSWLPFLEFCEKERF